MESFEVGLLVSGEGTAETNSEELELAFTHSWNCDKEDRRWFQSCGKNNTGRKTEASVNIRIHPGHSS